MYRALACLAFAVTAVTAGTSPVQTQSAAPAPLRFPKLPAVSPLGARNDLPQPFEPGLSWGQLPGGRKWGSTAGIAIDPEGNIWAIDRCGQQGAGGTSCFGSPLDPILEFNSSGRFLKGFGAGLFVSPHKITVDPDGNLWVADNGIKDGKGQQVLKFDRSGKLLMALGKAGVSGPGIDTFDQPTEVAVAPNGDIFVADGHGTRSTSNARIMKFDKNGTFLKTWGRKGTGIGEFDCVHTLAFDSQGRLFVGDRQNNRIQIFDQDGHFIAEWKQFGRPSGIFIDRNDVMYVADSESRDGEPGYGYNPGCARGIRIGSAKDGSVTSFVPDSAPYPPTNGSSSPEGVTAGADGRIYGAEFTMDVKKYIQKVPSLSSLSTQPSMNVFRRFSVDRAKMVEFYGDLLGLKPLPPIGLPGGAQMTRFQAGTSEIKLTTATQQEKQGAIRDVAGLRVLTFYFPDGAALVERFKAHGYPTPKFLGKPGTMKSALVTDPDGQWVDLVSAPGASDETYARLDIGLTVSDLERSRAFYRDFVGLEELKPVQDPILGTTKYGYRHGTTTVNLWTFGKNLPVDTTSAGIQYVVRDVEAVNARAKARNASITQPLGNFSATLRTIWLGDPDGVTNYFAQVVSK